MITQYELKRRVQDMRDKTYFFKSYFFDRETMKRFGDTMKNYKVSEGIIDTYTDKNVKVWILERRRPVKDGLQNPAYFRKENYTQTWTKD